MKPTLFRRALLALVAAAALLPALAGAQAAKSGKFTALGYAAPVPAAWQPQPPSSQFRLAQYRVPGTAGDAEVVVFFFGKGQGGSVAANIERWSSQFTAPDGKPVAPKTQVLSANGLPVTTVELNGSYARGMGSGPQGDAKPSQTLLVAVLEAPEGNVTIQLWGPRATVDAHRKGFEAMWRGFRKG
jgi:hypothetical protein